MTKSPKNILVTSAGRRVELIRAFKDSIAKLGVEAKVLSTDLAPELSSACQFTDDFFKVPAVTEKNYIENLVDHCVAHEVGLLVPTIDTELKLLSNSLKYFKEVGVSVAVSDPDFVEVCRDKRKTGDFFYSAGINYPDIYSTDKIKFPCFCKPYDGSSSIGARKILYPSDLTQDDLNNPKNMFMELVSDQYCEYTVDGYYDVDGRLCALVCRERLEVRGGEVSKGLTRKDFVYDYLVPRLKYFPGVRGCITFQFFVDKEKTDIKGLEINPRFGGGYPLTHQSGARFTDYLISEYFLGSKLDFFDGWESELLMLRYDAGVYKKYAK